MIASFLPPKIRGPLYLRLNLQSASRGEWLLPTRDGKQMIREPLTLPHSI